MVGHNLPEIRFRLGPQWSETDLVWLGDCVRERRHDHIRLVQSDGRPLPLPPVRQVQLFLQRDPALQPFFGWLKTPDYRGREEGTNGLHTLVDDDFEARLASNADLSSSTSSQLISQCARYSLDRPDIGTVAVLDLDRDRVSLKRFHVTLDERQNLIETLHVARDRLAQQALKVVKRELYAWRSSSPSGPESIPGQKRTAG